MGCVGLGESEVPMALQTSLLDSVLRIPPAKNWPSPNILILRTPCVNVHPSSSPLPILSRKIFPKPLRASTPQKYVYPDPIPEFAEAETEKFRVELLKKLSKEDTFRDDLHAVVAVCAQIFSEFLHKEYGGPGTLLVEPFTDMLVALKEKKLPGAPLAARASLLWAQNYVDQDWEVWNLKPKPPK
ncbi:protein PLASTID REDOX INSENSITIVE 2, chloroplastic-like [Vitis riparia]|uniref:protein PLASTID REDOX INSENSITIVE 2, chloroplastic-like n=1 Tax=Vitis riparia TaxID=96939 RepID=UPI00155ABBA2|nr:protein PLASTID REDOX INSENSITIVE 2, chloroplastic-like [Vitis riparia]